MRVKTFAAELLMGMPPLFRLASRLYHLANGGFHSLSPDAVRAIDEAFRYLVQKKSADSVGDYYEFGLFRGFTFQKAYQSAADIGLSGMRFYGFDSFAGLPDPVGIDKVDGRFFRGQFACSKKKVEENLLVMGVDPRLVTLIEGFYEESLTEDLRQRYPFKRAALVFLDCDYYSSSKTVLNWMAPYLTPGSILLFDDWYSYGQSSELGQQRAFGEFLAANMQFEAEELCEFKEHGKGFILRDRHPVL